MKSKNAPEEGDQSGVITSSATLTITKMIFFNLEKLLKTLIELKKSKKNGSLQQLVLIDEDQLELIVKLLTNNEQNGEIVIKIYDILHDLIDCSQHSSQSQQNISVLDMSKGLLQICIKHSSIYQCESAFRFLKRLVNVSDKYQNKQDIEYSLSKIMPATMRQSEKKP